jgi:hypothetical protein
MLNVSLTILSFQLSKKGSEVDRYAVRWCQYSKLYSADGRMIGE